MFFEKCHFQFFYKPFGVLEADSIEGGATSLSLVASFEGIKGGESGGFALFACEYKSNTWWQMSENENKPLYFS